MYLTRVGIWLVPTVYHYMSHISKKKSFVSRIEFIRSKLSNLSAHISGLGGSVLTSPLMTPVNRRRGSAVVTSHGDCPL